MPWDQTKRHKHYLTISRDLVPSGGIRNGNVNVYVANKNTMLVNPIGNPGSSWREWSTSTAVHCLTNAKTLCLLTSKIRLVEFELQLFVSLHRSVSWFLNLKGVGRVIHGREGSKQLPGPLVPTKHIGASRSGGDKIGAQDSQRRNSERGP